MTVDTTKEGIRSSDYRGLYTLFVDRPVLTLMVVLTIVLVGSISMNRLPLRFVPDGIEQNEIRVQIPIRLDRSPEEVRETVVEPLEELLRTIPGLERVRSDAGRSGASLRISLDDGMDPRLAAAEVRDRIQRARLQWPADVDRYFTWSEGGGSIPLALFQILTPDRTPRWDALLDDVVQPQLEAVDGIGRVDFWGLMDETIHIWFDQELITAYRLEFRELLRQLGADNFSEPVGELDNGRQRYLARVDMKFKSLSEIEEFPVRAGLKLKDIAHIERVPTVRNDLSRYDQKYTYLGVVYSSADANPVDTSHRLREAVATLANDPRLPPAPDGQPSVQFRFMFDQGQFIEGSLDTLLSAALLGGLLALLALLVFLRNLRMTAAIGLAIPLTMLIVGGWLYFDGGSLNLATMAGMTLAVGMVVDNSVVVLENIRRLREKGVPLRIACTQGAREVGLAVTMATLTTVVVFLPMVFMATSNASKAMMGGVGIPLSVALVGSLFVALLLLPSGVRALDAGTEREAGARTAEGQPRWSPMTALLGFNQRLLAYGLRHRLVVTLGAAAILATANYPFENLEFSGGGDIGPGRRGEVSVNLEFPRGLTLEDAEREVLAYEEFVLSHKEEWEVKGLGSRFGRGGGRIDLFLNDGVSSQETAALREEVFAAWPPRPGVEMKLQERQSGMGGGSSEEDDARNFVLRLWGRDTRTLMGLAEEVREKLAALPETATVEVPALERNQEVVVRLDRDRVQDLGVEPDSILGTMASALQGRELTRFEEAGREVRLVAQFDAEEDPSLLDLKETLIWSRGGEFRRLGDLSEITFERMVPNINSINNRTNVVLVGSRAPGVGPGEMQTVLQGVMDGVSLPRGYSWTEDSPSRQAEEEIQALLLAMLLSVTLVFLLMGVLFESVILPASILVTIPFALFGAFWSLYLFQGSVDPLSIIGMIILCGVVVNNGIVLLDLIERLRRQGLPRAEAILEGTRARLRPIVMTATTTIVGLLPMALFGETEEGSISYVGLSIAVAGGLAFCTVFTAFAVPMAYSFADDFSVWLQGVWHRAVQTAGQKVPN